MPEKITTALVGLICMVVGMLLGWFLKELSRAQKESGDRYHEALLGVRTVLENALHSCEEMDRNLYSSYMMALGRVEPYADRVGETAFLQLQYVLRSDLL